MYAALVLACLLALWPLRARALELRWTAPATCPSQQDVQARIDGLLRTGGKPASSVEQSAEARAKLSALRGGFKLVLTLRGEGLGGTRTLTGKDCTELAETAAFLIAVAIDPSLPGTAQPVAEPQPPAQPAPPPPPPPPVAPPATPEPAPRTVVERPLPFSVQASGFGGAWWASLPRRQTQLGASVGAAIGRVQLELRGAYALEDIERELGMDAEGMQSEGTLAVSSISFELAACHLWGTRFFAGPCGSLSLVRTHAFPDGFREKNDPTTLFWGSASIAGQVGMRVNRWLEPFIEAGLGTPISRRPSFAVQVSGQPPRDVTADRLLLFARLGVRFRWQPTRTFVAP